MRLPAELATGDTSLLVAVLQDYCGLLHAEHAFAGLSWPDAKQLAAAISFDVCTRDNAAEFLRQRAASVLDQRGDMVWRDRDAAARTLTLAADLLAMLDT